MLKWKRTSAKNTFELNGAEAASEKFNGFHQKLILYQISIYNVKDNKNQICKNCNNFLVIFVGDNDCIYNQEKCAVPIGRFPRLKDAKAAAQLIEDKFLPFVLSNENY